MLPPKLKEKIKAQTEIKVETVEKKTKKEKIINK